MGPGDRFRIKLDGSYDEHLRGKTGKVVATFIGDATSRTMAKVALDTPAVHPVTGFLVDTFFDYLDSFEEAVTKL